MWDRCGYAGAHHNDSSNVILDVTAQALEVCCIIPISRAVSIEYIYVCICMSHRPVDSDTGGDHHGESSGSGSLYASPYRSSNAPMTWAGPNTTYRKRLGLRCPMSLLSLTPSSAEC